VQTDLAEKRHSPRVRYACETRCFGVGESLGPTQIGDLSLEGAFLETVVELPIGTMVLLKFRAGGIDIKAEAAVARVMPGQGMGVTFLGMSSERRAALEQVLASRQEA
jgi:hypothetical protein